MSPRMKNALLITSFSAITAAITALLAAYAGAYWAEDFRIASRPIISPGGLSTLKPTPTIKLTGDDLFALDNLTSSEMPAQISQILTKLRSDLAAQLTQLARDNDLKEFSAFRTHRILSESPTFDVPLETVDELLQTIESRPSDLYRSCSAGNVGGKSVISKEKIQEILASSENSTQAVEKIRKLDPAMGDTLSVMLKTTSIGDFEIFKRFISALDMNNLQKEQCAETLEVWKKVRKLSEEARFEQTKGVKLVTFVAVTNMGQTPITLSKFGLLSTPDNGIMIPIEATSRPDRIILGPAKTEEITYESPRQDDIKFTWQQLESRRNDINAVGTIELFIFEFGRVLKSKPFSISVATNIRKSTIETILGPRRINADDIRRVMEGPTQSQYLKR